MSETWLPVRGLEEYYEVSDFGRVRSIRRYIQGKRRKYFVRGRIRKTHIDRNGYELISLMDYNAMRLRKYKVHRLVADAFIPNPHNLEQVDHINCDTQNNCVSNLNWLSRQDNVSAAHKLGKFEKLDHSLVRLIFKDYHTNGVSMVAICRKYKMNIKSVSRIIYRKTYSEVTKDMPTQPPFTPNNLLSTAALEWKYYGKYRISNYGDAIYDNHEIRFSVNSAGYFSLGRRSLHKIVAVLFVPNPHNHNTIHHINNDKLDNRACNLQWCTQSYNTLMAHKNLNIKKYHGETNFQSKLSNIEVAEIRKLASEGWSNRKLAKRYGASHSNINSIVRYQTRV